MAIKKITECISSTKISNPSRGVVVPAASSLATSTGGTIITGPTIYSAGSLGTYRYHIFTSSTIFVASGSGSIDIVLVGGGGGGGGAQSGGSSGNGGYGATVTSITRNITAGSYIVTVGGAGTGGAVGSSGTAGTASSITGITGATAAGGALGLGGAQSGAYLAGNGAGGNRGTAATSTVAQIPGPGLAVSILSGITIPSSLQWFVTEFADGSLYLAAGGASGVNASTSAGSTYGPARMGGGGGSIDATYFPNMNANVGGNRNALINFGGGGRAGLRASTNVSAGFNGGSGMVIIRYVA